jgi:hypothetical protein
VSLLSSNAASHLSPEVFEDIWKTLDPFDYLIQPVGLIAFNEIVYCPRVVDDHLSEDVEVATPLLDTADVLLTRKELRELQSASGLTAEDQADDAKAKVFRPPDRDRRVDQVADGGSQPLADRRLGQPLWPDRVVDALRDPVLREMACVSGERKQLHREVGGLRWAAACPSSHFLIISKEMSLSITPDALLPLVVAVDESDFIPAQPWALDLALVALAREVEPGSEIAMALARIPRSPRPDGQQFVGLRRIVHRLVERGRLIPGGTGWHAGYAVTKTMREEGAEIASALRVSDRAALAAAAQALRDATRMLSKNAAASRPRGSATI